MRTYVWFVHKQMAPVIFVLVSYVKIRNGETRNLHTEVRITIF